LTIHLTGGIGYSIGSQWVSKMTNRSMTLAFAMCIGPGEAEMAIDNLDAIRQLYPDAVVWVRDDRTDDGTWEEVSGWVTKTGSNTLLSRNPSCFGYHGIMRTFGHLLLEVAPARPDLLIKIDPDTVLIRRGLDRIFQDRFARNGPGMSGTYRISATGAKRRFRNHAAMVMLDLLPIGPKKKLRRMRWGPTSYSPFILKALMRGYRPGEHVQGGLFAIHGSTLQKLLNSGFLEAIAFGRSGMVWTEDVMLAVGTKAVGDTLSSLNEGLLHPSSHIQAARPLNISVDRLHDSCLLAVHPVKRVDHSLRSTLRDLRMLSV
jgi:hypothetical protein